MKNKIYKLLIFLYLFFSIYLCNSEDVKRFYIKEKGYSIELPISWERDKSKEAFNKIDIALIIPDKKFSGFELSELSFLNIICSQLHDNITLDDLVNTIINNFKELIDESKDKVEYEYDIVDIIIDNIKAKKILISTSIYEDEYGDKPFLAKTLIYFIIDDNNIYNINFNVSHITYLKYKDLFEKIALSLKFNCSNLSNDVEIYQSKRKKAGYRITNSKVIYYDYEYGLTHGVEDEWKINTADPKTFIVLNEDLNLEYDYYAIDKNHVYYKGSIFKNIKPNTLMQIKGYYWKDEKNIYFLESGKDFDICKLQDVDISTFIIHIIYPWSFDKSNFYWERFKVEEIQYFNFQPINLNWAKDNFNYYFHTKKIKNIDYKTFKVLNENYAKDKNNVYFTDIILENCNVEKFIVLENGLGYDGNLYFIGIKNSEEFTEFEKKFYKIK